MPIDNQFSYCSNNPINHSDSDGYSWINDALNWIDDKFVKPIGSFVSGMIENYREMQSTNARLTQAVAKKVIVDIDNTIEAAKKWWNRNAKPWLSRVFTEAQQFINKAVDIVRDTWRTQVEINYRIMRVRLDATLIIGRWVANNWIYVINGASTGISGAYAIYSILPYVGVAVPPLSLPLNLIGFFCFCWEAGKIIYSSIHTTSIEE